MDSGLKLVFFQTIAASLVILVMSSPRKDVFRLPLGKPENMSTEEFLETRGQGRSEMALINSLALRIKLRFLQSGKALPTDVDDKFDDVVFTASQLRTFDRMLARRGRRWKRKVVNPEVFQKWPSTIVYYVFDGSHTAEQQADIRKATDHWAERTCIRFVEGGADVQNYPYIYFTRNDSQGCWSYIGRIVDTGPQILNLASSCFYTDGRFGTVVHELGHALGFIHEHTRSDRDQYVTVHLENVLSGAESNFVAWEASYLDSEILAKVPYDYSSVMHYSSTSFSVNSEPTIDANNPLYAPNMGQRNYLSFFDGYAMNLAYCVDVCGTTSEPPCLHGGYQDPNNCGSCLCPDGFTGAYCETDLDNTAVCPDSGSLFVGIEEQCIEVNLASSAEDIECDWHIQTVTGCNINFWFESINLLCWQTENMCYDFVEIKYENNLVESGPRFCCYNAPDSLSADLNTYLTSNIEELMVSFRNYYYSETYRPSFKLCFQVSSDLSCTVTNDTTTTTSSTTSTTTTTTTTTTEPTTTTTTTEPITTTTTTEPTTTTTTTEPTTTTTTTEPTTTTTTTEPTTTTITTTNTSEGGKKHNRIQTNRTKKLNKQLVALFGATTPAGLPEKRKALRQYVKELRGQSDSSGK